MAHTLSVLQNFAELSQIYLERDGIEHMRLDTALSLGHAVHAAHGCQHLPDGGIGTKSVAARCTGEIRGLYSASCICLTPGQLLDDGPDLNPAVSEATFPRRLKNWRLPHLCMIMYTFMWCQLSFRCWSGSTHIWLPSFWCSSSTTETCCVYTT